MYLFKIICKRLYLTLKIFGRKYSELRIFRNIIYFLPLKCFSNFSTLNSQREAKKFFENSRTGYAWVLFVLYLQRNINRLGLVYPTKSVCEVRTVLQMDGVKNNNFSRLHSVRPTILEYALRVFRTLTAGKMTIWVDERCSTLFMNAKCCKKFILATCAAHLLADYYVFIMKIGVEFH